MMSRICLSQYLHFFSECQMFHDIPFNLFLTNLSFNGVLEMMTFMFYIKYFQEMAIRYYS